MFYSMLSPHHYIPQGRPTESLSMAPSLQRFLAQTQAVSGRMVSSLESKWRGRSPSLHQHESLTTQCLTTIVPTAERTDVSSAIFSQRPNVRCPALLQQASTPKSGTAGQLGRRNETAAMRCLNALTEGRLQSVMERKLPQSSVR